MLNCLCKPTIISIPEFLNSTKKYTSNKMVVLENTVKHSRKFEKVLIITMAIVMNISVCAAKAGGIDGLGYMIIDLIRHWAYFILIIMCIVEVIRAGIGGDSNKILSIVMRYLLIFMSMYLVPDLFDAIRDAL